MKYGLNDRPGPLPMLLYGLQWWAVSLPCVVIMGVVLARMHFAEVGERVFYLQKLFGLVGLATLAQIYLGHRLPLVIGPATILLVGLTASVSAGLEAAYTAMMTGGLALAAVAVGGLFSQVRKIFTPRIVTVILILIAFTISPTILNLILAGTDRQAGRLCFATLLVLAMVVCNRRLPGVWKSMTVLIGLSAGTLACFFLFGLPEPVPHSFAAAESLLLNRFDFNAGVILSFLFCFLALSVNELGSIESIGHMLSADDMGGRVRRGLAVAGLSNLACGAAGVIGPVSFSLSAGVIAATGCASRHTLAPAGAGLLLCSLFPEAVLILSRLPGAVLGALLLYLMSAQLSSGLHLLVSEKCIVNFNDGLIIGLPLMLGLLTAFAPAGAFDGFPGLLRPIVANGFIVGTIAVIIMEHLILGGRRR